MTSTPDTAGAVRRCPSSSALLARPRLLAAAITALGAACVLCSPRTPAAELPKAPVPKSPYIAVVYRYADTMLERGRDVFGPQATGLFLSALDRATLAPLTNRPPAPGGLRDDQRVGAPAGPLTGANPQHDQNLLRLLYFLSDHTTKPKYRDAADAALKWFLQNARSPSTGQLAWGERSSWDVIADQPVFADRPPPNAHEFFRPWLLWDRCFELAPDPSRAFAVRLAEQSTQPDPASGAFERHAGFHLRTWAVAYTRTKDERFLQAVETLLRRFEQTQRPGTASAETAERSAEAWPVAALSLAIDCHAAANCLPEPLASRLRALAAREDAAFCALPHGFPDSRGFLLRASPAKDKLPKPVTPLWVIRAAEPTTAQVGMMCVARYDNGGNPGHRKLFLAAADEYLQAPPPETEDLWPATFGHAISLQVAAWRHSARPAYLERARQLADFAVEKFWGTNALPRASLKREHYESITGADTLALALAELHLHVLHITAARCPSNTADR